jgi:hypothetical protein
VIHTWPLARGPGVLSRNDTSDTQLNEWILAWIAHQLPRDPLRLFQANIFHPARDTLAFSEPLIVPGVIGIPIFWAGASPVLAYNLLLMIGFALTGLATYALAWAWTRDRFAAVVAGSLFAFNAHTLTRLVHIQAIHAYGLPLALFFADRLIVRPDRTGALGLALSMALLTYTSGYLAIFGVVMIAIVLAARAADWWQNPRGVIAGFALATIVAAVVVLPVYLPYRRVSIEQGLVRSISEARQFSTIPGDYLAAVGRIHFSTWSSRFFRHDAFFPGVACMVLSGVAVWGAVARRTDRARVLMLCAIGVVGVILSFGPRTPIYGWLFTIFPPMQGLRGAARFGILFLLATSCLAAYGLAAVRRAHAGTRWVGPLAVAAVVIVNAETLRAPLWYFRFEGIPRIYDVLAGEPGRVVLVETPFYPSRRVFGNAEYVINSTAHWRPMLNGYSGFTPQSYRRFAEVLSNFPDEAAIAMMREAGVTHVTVHPHPAATAERTKAVLSARPDFHLLATAQGISLYRLQ